jgi:hypothetical protein
LKIKRKPLATSTIEKIKTDNLLEISKENAVFIDNSFSRFKSYLDIVTLAASKAHAGYLTPKNTGQKGKIRVLYSEENKEALARETENLSSIECWPGY